MVEVVWTEPSLNDLDAIADYIAIDNPTAAASLVQRVFAHVDRLQDFPLMGSRPKELRGLRYRQIIEPPCRIFYRNEGPKKIVILHVIREEQLLKKGRLVRRQKKGKAQR